jgi:hypothetical protein
MGTYRRMDEVHFLEQGTQYPVLEDVKKIAMKRNKELVRTFLNQISQIKNSTGTAMGRQRRMTGLTRPRECKERIGRR